MSTLNSSSEEVPEQNVLQTETDKNEVLHEGSNEKDRKNKIISDVAEEDQGLGDGVLLTCDEIESQAIEEKKPSPPLVTETTLTRRHQSSAPEKDGEIAVSEGLEQQLPTRRSSETASDSDCQMEVTPKTTPLGSSVPAPTFDVSTSLSPNSSMAFWIEEWMTYLAPRVLYLIILSVIYLGFLYLSIKTLVKIAS